MTTSCLRGKLVSTMLLSLLALPAFAGKAEGDESDLIQKRIDWFYGRRGLDVHQVGADFSSQRAHRGAEAQKLAAQVEAQRANRVLGTLWTSIGPAPMTMLGWAFGNVAGRVTSVAIDPTNSSIHYVTGATGGLWKTTDGGTTYASLFDQIGTQGMGGVAVAAYDHNVLWVGTGDFICDGYYGMGAYRSTDGGSTWEQRNGTGSSQMLLAGVSSVVLHPTNPAIVIMGGPIACGGSGGIYYSSDAGLSWSRVAANTIHEIARDPSNPSILYAANAGTTPVLKSVDGGLTWSPMSTGLPTGGGRCEVAVAPSDPQTVYFLHTSGNFYRSQNGGTSWTQQSTGACDGQCSYNMTIEVNATSRDTVYRGTIRLFRSTDAGVTWTALTTNWGSAQKVHQDTHVIRRHPTDPNSFYVGSDGGLWKTTDGGSTFQNLNGNLNMTQFYDIAIDPTTDTILLGGSQDNSSEAYSGTRVWGVVKVTGDGFVNAINPAATNVCYVASYPAPNPNIYRSTTGPQGTYSNVSGGITDNAGWVTPYVLDPVTPDTMYVGADRVWKSTNRGTSWSVTSPAITGGPVTTITVAPSAPMTIYVGASGGTVERTTDGGATWTNVTGNLPTGADATCVRVDPVNANHVYATIGSLSSPVFWYSTTGGTTWTAATNGIPTGIPGDSILVLGSPSRIYVGTDIGVYVSKSGDAGPYVADMNGMPVGVVISDLEYNASTNTISAGTFGRGAWQQDATAVDTWDITVAKGAGSPVANDSQINAYRGDGARIPQIDFAGYTATGYGANHAGGDVTGDKIDEVLAGEGPGPSYPPVCKGFTNAGAAIAGINFAAYGGAGYGLNVAAGDLDADDIREIVTGPGEGSVYGPQVRAFNYDNSGTITPIAKINYFAYSTLRYGVNVASTSFDTDGNYDEILTGAGPGDVFGPHVRGWNYDNGTLTAVSKVSFFAFSTLKYGVNVSGGDVERDGIDEILAGAGPGAVFGSAVRGFNYDGASLTAISKINFIAFGTGRYGANVAAGDIDGDGYVEIPVGPGPDPSLLGLLKVFDYDGTALSEILVLTKTVWPGASYGTTVGTGNYGF